MYSASVNVNRIKTSLITGQEKSHTYDLRELIFQGSSTYVGHL